MLKLMNKVWRDERGVSAIEYALLAAIVASAVVAAGAYLTSTTGGLPYIFQTIMLKITGALPN
ncbi:MAG TPA: Flp family type IVb pilin [Paraburkholderia sp.]|nr:Flp family type IVb pilin [Paraburkholderia sp.]